MKIKHSSAMTSFTSINLFFYVGTLMQTYDREIMILVLVGNNEATTRERDQCLASRNVKKERLPEKQIFVKALPSGRH